MQISAGTPRFVALGTRNLVMKTQMIAGSRVKGTVPFSLTAKIGTVPAADPLRPGCGAGLHCRRALPRAIARCPRADCARLYLSMSAVQRHRRGGARWRFDPERLDPVWDDLQRRQPTANGNIFSISTHRQPAIKTCTRSAGGTDGGRSLRQFDPGRLDPVWDDRERRRQRRRATFSRSAPVGSLCNVYEFTGRPDGGYPLAI